MAKTWNIKLKQFMNSKVPVGTIFSVTANTGCDKPSYTDVKKALENQFGPGAGNFFTWDKCEIL